VESVHSKKLENCRICDSDKLVIYLDLGNHPASNSFIFSSDIAAETRFPLRVVLCTNCGLSQLDTIVFVQEVFNDYAYRSSTSRALMESFKELALRVTSTEKHNTSVGKQLVVDIGCNDGYLLKQFDEKKFELLGIEPSSAAVDAITSGLNVERCFFGFDTAQELRIKYGAADFLLVTNVMAHVPDIRSFVQGISHWLSAEGTFYVEFPYILDLVENRCFDTIYHEHLSYLSITPLVGLFKEYGLQIIDIEKCEVGGSGPFLRVSAKKNSSNLNSQTSIVSNYLNAENIFDLCNPLSYRNFASQVERIRLLLLNQIYEWKALGLNIGGYGAPAKGNTLLNHLNLEPGVIRFIADNTPEKVGKLTPGSHIPIINDQEFEEHMFDVALLLSWNYLEYFLANSSYFKNGGAFYVPFPTPQIYGKIKGQK
jgi:SAM-dependent methyltransferase